jgi:hypothetical protein
MEEQVMRIWIATTAMGLAGCAAGGGPSPANTRPALPAAPSAPPLAEQACVPLQWIDDTEHETQDAARAVAFVVPIELDGQTYRFQFDTGADVTILYGTDLARARGWKLEDGGDHPFARVSGSFAARPFQSRPIVVFADMPSSDLGAGTIGMDLLVDRVTTIDFPAKRVCLYDQMPEEIERRASFAPAVLDHDRMPVTGTLAGHVYKRIQFDTGTSHFALVGSFDSWKRWTGLDGEAGVTDRVAGGAWGHEVHILGAPATGTLSVASFSVEHPMVYFYKEKPDLFGDPAFPQDAIMGNAPFLKATIVLDARRAKPRFGVVTTQ